MSTGSSYEELAPPAALRDGVSRVWRRTTGAGGEPVRILPDACVDLIWQRGEGAFLAGPDTGPNLVTPAPATTLVGVRFRPGAGGPALGLPLAGFRDQRLPIAELDPALADSLPPDLALGDALRRLVGIAARMVRSRPPDRAVAEAARALASPATRVAALARDLGLSERQLRRRSEAAVGYGPKTLQRVLRLQRVVERLAAPDPPADVDLAGLAFEAGYADQSHLTRECGALTGLTPAALAAARRPSTAP